MERVGPEVVVRVEYALTPKGRGLADAIKAISNWADKWTDEPQPAGRSARPARRRAS